MRQVHARTSTPNKKANRNRRRKDQYNKPHLERRSVGKARPQIVVHTRECSEQCVGQLTGA
jgi:hypothetical protein